MSQTSKSKLLGLLLSVVQTVLIIGLVAIALVSFASRIPFLAQKGLTFYSVVSGSMEPTLPVGSLLYAGRYKVEDLKKDDIITFTVEGADQQTAVVTHRIVEAKKTEKTEKDPEGNDKLITQYSFQTKGDANNEADPVPVQSGAILGLYKWHLPYLGRVSMFAQTPVGFGLVVLLPAAILIVWEITSLVLHFKQEYQRKSEAEISKLKEELLKRREADHE